ncbi:MAG: hypothetical protein ACPGYV_13430 [Phycisphaeraceae bacterium]
MLNPSDTVEVVCADSAEAAQLLRGGGCFGAIVYIEGRLESEESIIIDAGYADCLPILSGGLWRDPVSLAATETLA